MPLKDLEEQKDGFGVGLLAVRGAGGRGRERGGRGSYLQPPPPPPAPPALDFDGMA